MLRKLCIAAALCGVVAGPAAADSLELTGVVRDFKRGDQNGGHPDFETAGAKGRFGHVKGLVSLQLGEDRLPVFNPTRPGTDTITSAASLAQWFKDVPNVNQSAPLTLTLEPTGTAGIYSYASNAFFPINGKMFGNQGLNQNFHFTFELHTEFSYEPGQKFTFIGDDDVWVYVNGTRVIDLGGVHSAVTGSVLLFDGKAFVEKRDYTAGGVVKSVSSSMRSSLATQWTRLGLGGTCPIKEGDLYIDLNLNDGLSDARVKFSGSSITVYTAKDLSNVVMKFADGSVQRFEDRTGYQNTFAGTGAASGKQIIGVWVQTGPNNSGDGSGYGQYFSHDSGSDRIATLDFFFAERHTTQSNFRIDTSMRLRTSNTATTSALYD